MSEKRKQALRELDGELSQLSRNLVNAGYLAQDIMEDYFEGIDATADKGPYLLAYEHPRYLSKMDVLMGILTDSRDAVKQLLT